jgi:uncharacterized protein (DUF1499 family)
METFRTWWVRLALLIALLLPVYFLAASLGTKFGYLDWTVGFGQMTFVWGPRVLLGAAGLAFIALLLVMFIPPRKGFRAALVALIIPLLGLGYGMYVRNAAASIPPIHDISTDLDNPPAFSEAVVRARAAVESVNDLDLLNKFTREGRPFTELQRENYADIAPVTTTLDPVRAFNVALDLAREQGWTIGEVNMAAGAFEATDQTFWYGFTDDIAVRVRLEGADTRIDVRSVSRVGRSDLGANAARLRPYLQELRARLETASAE